MTQLTALDKLTTAQKIELMEAIWEDLTRTPESIPSPAWHKDLLEHRERMIREGKAHFEDWETVKEELRIRTAA